MKDKTHSFQKTVFMISEFGKTSKAQKKYIKEKINQFDYTEELCSSKDIIKTIKGLVTNKRKYLQFVI